MIKPVWNMTQISELSWNERRMLVYGSTPDKCIIACNKLPFFWHLLTNEGLKLDAKKAEAISNKDPSASLTDLQTFLGMVQFLAVSFPTLHLSLQSFGISPRKAASSSGTRSTKQQ
jgi:hypothetical protein